jgi:hypothetical protein
VTSSAQTAARRAEQRRAVPARPRNPARVAVAVLLVVGSALISLQLYRSAGDRKPYLVARVDMPVGHRVTAADLSTVDLASEGTVKAIGGGQESLVVGKVMRAPVTAGTLLTIDMMAGDRVIPDGQGVVAVPVSSGMVPTGVRSGDKAWFVIQGGAPNQSIVESTVWDVSKSDSSTNQRVVTAVVPLTKVLALTTAAGDGKVAVVWVNPGATATASPTTAAPKGTTG